MNLFSHIFIYLIFVSGKFNEAVELGTFCEDNSEVKISVGLQHFVPLETTSCGGGSSGMGGGGGVETMSLNGCVIGFFFVLNQD